MKNYLASLFLMMPFYQIANAQNKSTSTVVTFEKTFGGKNYDVGNSVQQTSDGGYIITGGTRSSETELDDVYLIKTDANGNPIWTKTYGGSNSETGATIQLTIDGGYIIVGTTSSFGINPGFFGGDVYLIKTNANGDIAWSKTYGGTNLDGGSSLLQTIDGGYIVAGSTWSFGAG